MTTTNSKERATIAPKMIHLEGCNESRPVEITEHKEAGIVTFRCIDCGAHVAIDRHGKPLKKPTVTGAYAGHSVDNSDLIRTVNGGN